MEENTEDKISLEIKRQKRKEYSTQEKNEEFTLAEYLSQKAKENYGQTNAFVMKMKENRLCEQTEVEKEEIKHELL